MPSRGELKWMKTNKKKIEQFFKGQKYSFQELIDNIEYIEVEEEEQVIEEIERKEGEGG